MEDAAHDFENNEHHQEGDGAGHKELPERMMQAQDGQEAGGQRGKGPGQENAKQKAKQGKGRADRAATTASQPGHSHAEQSNDPHHAGQAIPHREK